jgi:hypothetical protein
MQTVIVDDLSGHSVSNFPMAARYPNTPIIKIKNTATVERIPQIFLDI